MTTQQRYVEAEVRELEDDDAAEPDLYIGADDFAGVSGGRGVATRNNPDVPAVSPYQTAGVSVSEATLIGGGAVFGYSLGDSFTQRLAFAALGAAAGALAAHLAHENGWV